jgi:hypothetical protein
VHWDLHLLYWTMADFEQQLIVCVDDCPLDDGHVCISYMLHD